MKKFIIMIMVMTMFCLTTATAYNTASIDYKDAITYKDKRNFNFNYNERKLSDYLKLNTDEKNDLFDIHRTFNEKMKRAAYINDKEKQSNEIIKAINFELDNAKAILDSVQYDKFLTIFTRSLNDKEFFENIRFEIEKN